MKLAAQFQKKPATSQTKSEASQRETTTVYGLGNGGLLLMGTASGTCSEVTYIFIEVASTKVQPQQYTYT